MPDYLIKQIRLPVISMMFADHPLSFLATMAASALRARQVGVCIGRPSQPCSEGADHSSRKALMLWAKLTQVMYTVARLDYRRSSSVCSNKALTTERALASRRSGDGALTCRTIASIRSTTMTRSSLAPTTIAMTSGGHSHGAQGLGRGATRRDLARAVQDTNICCSR